MSLISKNLQAVHKAIAQAAEVYGRNPTEIALLAVSKTFSADDVIEAIRAGQLAFGENYVQEAVEKIQLVNDSLVFEKVADLPVSWHFIGPIQSNKTALIAQHFSWVHSLDRNKIANRLSEQRPSELGELNICLQVNISGEDSKSGVSPDQLLALAQHVQALPKLKLRGLMAVPAAVESVEAQSEAFRQLRLLKERLCEQGILIDTLSMGMSGDMEAAIAEGSTILRIGSAIFGKRNYAS